MSLHFNQKLALAYLPDECGDFDINDPLHCHAFIWLLFVCCSCGRAEFYEDENYPDVRWAVTAAKRARGDGWTLAAPSPDDVFNGQLRCPDCSRPSEPV